jgi:GNAT superfamily N-acetyltransferase
MGIMRFTLPTDQCAAGFLPSVVIESFRGTQHEAEIAALVGRCAAVDGPSAAGPSVASLEAELTSLPGRQIRAWLARAGDQRAPVGVVTLVAAGAEDDARFSIGWLFVDPVFRRRGIGRALVARAMREAGSLGARGVHAETRDRWKAAVAFWGSFRLAAAGVAARIQMSGESRETAEG